MITRRRTADPQSIRSAITLLRADQIVAFPTETVYGLGGRADSQVAIDRIYAAKRRPADNPLIVHVARLEDAAKFCHVDARARALAAAFWPGPLTLVLPRIAPIAAAGTLDTVAIRAPDHPVALALLDGVGPLAAPSANRSGRPSPTRADHVLADLTGRIPLVLDAGPCTVGIESTVLALYDEAPRVLRPGAITAAQIAAHLGPIGAEEASVRTPGSRYRHYQPRSPVVLVADGVDARSLCTQLAGATLIDRGERLTAYLYADLRAADGARWIILQGVDADLAVMERARKAATHDLSTAEDVERFVQDHG
ncbi:MAG: L-threonylcarbamoyladenylate synthase [Bradymonadia bacterium]|jgi:L-threonylcarbamoyladenylate synthase